MPNTSAMPECTKNVITLATGGNPAIVRLLCDNLHDIGMDVKCMNEYLHPYSITIHPFTFTPISCDRMRAAGVCEKVTLCKKAGTPARFYLMKSKQITQYRIQQRKLLGGMY